LSYSTQIRQVGAELFHADGQTRRSEYSLFAVVWTRLKTTHPSARVSLIPLYQQIIWQFTITSNQILYSCLYLIQKAYLFCTLS